MSIHYLSLLLAFVGIVSRSIAFVHVSRLSSYSSSSYPAIIQLTGGVLDVTTNRRHICSCNIPQPFRLTMTSISALPEPMTSLKPQLLPYQKFIDEIIEPAAKSMIQNVQFSKITVPAFISQNGFVAGSYSLYKGSNTDSTLRQKPSTATNDSPKQNIFSMFNWPSTTTSNSGKGVNKKLPPIVLLHGFDSSFLEFRRLAPKLAEETKRDVYVPDILGWGFIDHSNVKDFGPEAKLQYMKSFLEQVVGGPCVLVGASLGGAVAINLAVDYPALVDRLVLINAQGFIDGKGPSDIADIFATAGVNVLKSTFIRKYANTIAYANPKKFGTEDAMRIGRLHCMVDSWQRASIGFLKSGGFIVSDKVAKVQQETLVLWGRNDKILEPSTANRFEETLQSCTLQWVENAGHVPHLEVPEETTSYMKEFLA